MGALKSQLVSRLTTGMINLIPFMAGTKKYLDDLIYSIIRGQKDSEGNKKKFLVRPDDINPLWKRGATEVIRE